MIYQKRKQVIESLNNLQIHSDENYKELQLFYITQLEFDINQDEWFDQLKQNYCQIQIILSPFRIFKQRQLRLGNLNLQNDSQQLLTNYLRDLISKKLSVILIIIQNRFHLEYKNKSSYLFELIELIANINQKNIYIICQNNQLKFEFQKTNILSIEYNEIRNILEQFYNQLLIKDDPVQIVIEQEYIQQIFDDQLLRTDILIIINDIVFEDLLKWRHIIENIDFNDQIKSLSLLKLVQNFQQNHSPSKGGNQLQFKYYEKFKAFLINYIQYQLQEFVLNKTIISQSNEILEFLQYINKIICEKYPISSYFQNIVFNAIQQVMHEQQYKNIVLVFMDKCIMEQNQNILKSLKFVIQIYQNDQQFFQQIYLNYQSKFINCVIPQITYLDHQILKLMEEQVNNNFIQLLKQIFRDVLSSNLEDNFFLLVIPQNQWNLTNNNQLQLNFGISYNQALAQNFNQHNQNKLIYINDTFSKASIIYRPQKDKRRLEIHLYATQLAILLQFQNNDQQHYQDLFLNSQLDQDSFNFELAILIKKGLIIQQHDILYINKNLESKQKLILLQKRHIKIQNEQVQQDGDLAQKVQALVIKIVKQNKNGIHFMDLKFQINQIIKFTDIKNVLENLIDLNYIQRNKNDRQLIQYLSNIIIYHP